MELALMTTPTWHSDAFGTYVLEPPQGGRVWIEAQPYHSDRGHWSLGLQSLRSPDGVEPSLYFMEMDTAIREAELWLARTAGRPVGLQDEESLPPGLRQEWTIAKLAGHVAWTSKHGETTTVVFMEGTEDDPLWKVEIDHLDLDDGDVFPRHFLRLEHAVLEAEAFLRWRINKVPAEASGPIDLPPREVDPVIARHLAPAARTSMSL
jgi:hypothetical protein